MAFITLDLALMMKKYTWCEGDTTLTLFSDRETYQKEREATEKWFDEN